MCYNKNIEPDELAKKIFCKFLQKNLEMSKIPILTHHLKDNWKN